MGMNILRCVGLRFQVSSVEPTLQLLACQLGVTEVKNVR